MACKIARERTVAGSQVNAGVTQVRGARSTANPDLRHDTFDHRLNRSCTDISRPISERQILTLKVYWRPGCIVQLSPSGEARGTATWSGPILTRLAISYADVVLALQVQPELRAVAEVAAEPHCGVGRNRTAKANDMNCRPDASHSASKITRSGRALGRHRLF